MVNSLAGSTSSLVMMVMFHQHYSRERFGGLGIYPVNYGRCILFVVDGACRKETAVNLVIGYGIEFSLPVVNRSSS